MLTLLQNQPFVSTVMGGLLLLAGVLALLSAFASYGGPAGDPQERRRRVHRAAGWGFVTLAAGMVGYMIWRLALYREEVSPRVTLHIALALAVLCGLAIKVAIVKFGRGPRQAVVTLGIGIFVLAFTTVGLTGGYYLLRKLSGTPYVSHGSFDIGFSDDALGKEFLIARCTMCHLLENVLVPRPEKEWEPLVNRMMQIAEPRISTAEGSLIIGYLARNYARRPAAAEGVSLVERHCLQCHREEEIFAQRRDFEGWRKIVRRMSALDPQAVPRDDVDAIAESIVSRERR